MGIQAGIWQYRANFNSVNLSKDITAQQDGAFQNNINRWDPNFGFGAYYYTKIWFYEKYAVGLSVRTADAIAVLLEAQATKQWRFGYSYDYSYTKLRKYNSGSHEIMVRYEFSYQKSKLLTPRYF